MNIQEDFKSDRLNFEVALYKGCTLHEMMLAALLGFTLSIVTLTVLFWFLFNAALLGVAFGIPAGFAVMLILAIYIGSLKQNRPQGYYQQLIMLKLENHGLMKSPFVRRSGRWSIRRTFL